jgi:drug/metabolite transporter (DMT)-like permease
VCILSWIFLRRRYNRWEISGVCLALIGIIFTVLASLIQENWEFKGSVEGDCIVLLGTVLYAV